MHLKRFNEFVVNLRDDPAVGSFVHTVDVYRRFQDVWYHDEGSEVEEPNLVKALTRTLRLDGPWRRKNDTRAFFPLPALEAVIVGNFQSRPTEATQRKVHEHISSCLKRCSDAYRARHDGLTELLNRQAFDTLLRDTLTRFGTADPESLERSDASFHFSSLLLIMLDIDFFKRVNDNYGHAYGDVVLRSFAIRLEQACEELTQRKGYTCETFCARPSGEEFSVLIVGGVKQDAELEVAEFFRREIASHPLPSESELAVMADDPKLHGLQLPPLRERGISASVGLSARHSGIPSTSADTVAESLKIEADLALYRAKRLGRDRCVRFTDIVQRHGQVLEHHTDVEVVAIDLGQQVGVSLGQEFLVFHPDFTGAKPFLLGDGRGERRLGKFPRVPYGRLEVFDVQPEISFCYVAEKRGTGRFPLGALLEAVPPGSIAHLISKDWWQWEQLKQLSPDLQNIEQALRNVEPWDDASVICLGLANKERLLTARGAGLVNRVYASLYTALKECFRGDLVAQINPEQFAVVIHGEAEALQERLSSLVNRVEELHHSTPSIAVGLFTQSMGDLIDIPENGEPVQPVLEFEHGLVFAQAAFELGVRKKERLVAFTTGSAGELLRYLRMNKEYDLLDSMYEAFRDVGIRNTQMESECAVSSFFRRDFAKAVEVNERALALDPENRSARAAQGVFLVAAGQPLAAAEVFAKLPPTQRGEGELFRVARTMAAYEKFREDPSTVDEQGLVQSLWEIRGSRTLRLLGIRSSDVYLAHARVRSHLSVASPQAP